MKIGGKKRIAKNITATALAFSLAYGSFFSGGCATTKTKYPPNLFEGYSSISEKASDIIDTTKEKLNIEVIHDKDKPLPIYEKQFEINEIGDSQIIRYHSRNIDCKMLASTLEKQLGNYTEGISVVPETNQVLIRMKKQGNLEGKVSSITSDEVKNLIESIDLEVPSIMLKMVIVKTFADYTKDISSMLEVKQKEAGDVSPDILFGVPGAGLRTIERGAAKGLGFQYGVVGRAGEYLIKWKLDQLESMGFAEYIASPVLVVSNGKSAEIKLKQEQPYKDDVVTGSGLLLATTKFKPVETFMQVTPYARDNGNIFLNVSAGVGSFNPVGVLQLLGITQRDIKNEGVEIKQGQTLVIAGVKIDDAIAVERKDPWFKHIPLFGKLFSGEDQEKSMKYMYFMVTPEYIDVDIEKTK